MTAIGVLAFEAAAEIAAPERKRGTPTCTEPEAAQRECGWKRGERRNGVEQNQTDRAGRIVRSGSSQFAENRKNLHRKGKSEVLHGLPLVGNEGANDRSGFKHIARLFSLTEGAFSWKTPRKHMLAFREGCEHLLFRVVLRAPRRAQSELAPSLSFLQSTCKRSRSPHSRISSVSVVAASQRLGGEIAFSSLIPDPRLEGRGPHDSLDYL